MDHNRFTVWMEAYRTALENRDPSAIETLFCENATYQETPYDEPLQGRSAIRAFWANIPRVQENIKFEYRILAVHSIMGIAHWQATFLRHPSRTQVKLDGILVAEFNGHDCCFKFREWSHRQEKKIRI